MESFKQQVDAVQACQSALRMPEEVVNNLSICRTALNLQQEASQLQHTAIQQCNILQVWDNTEEIYECFKLAVCVLLAQKVFLQI